MLGRKQWRVMDVSSKVNCLISFLDVIVEEEVRQRTRIKPRDEQQSHVNMPSVRIERLVVNEDYCQSAFKKAFTIVTIKPRGKGSVRRQ